MATHTSRVRDVMVALGDQVVVAPDARLDQVMGTLAAFCQAVAPVRETAHSLVDSAACPSGVTRRGPLAGQAARRPPLPRRGRRVERRGLQLPAEPAHRPYLAIAATVAAGLHRIDKGLTLEDEYVGNAYESSRPRVPASLREARDLFAASETAHEAFGSDVVEHYCNMARVELEAFDTAVTDWERYRGFERL